MALLIGNMHYLHHKHLRAPMVDVHALSSLLRQLDFKVVSLLDLGKDEMQMAVNEFLLLLDKGVYGGAASGGTGGACTGGVWGWQGEKPGVRTGEGPEAWGGARRDVTRCCPLPPGLLYYAGHGYENFGNSFMVPIDAPSSYTSAHCLCVQRVLRCMQQRHTGLNIFLLDMCRKR